MHLLSQRLASVAVLDTSVVDLILTDPPYDMDYGIARAAGSAPKGAHAGSAVYVCLTWRAPTRDPRPPFARRALRLPPAPCGVRRAYWLRRQHYRPPRESSATDGASAGMARARRATYGVFRDAGKGYIQSRAAGATQKLPDTALAELDVRIEQAISGDVTVIGLARSLRDPRTGSLRFAAEAAKNERRSFLPGGRTPNSRLNSVSTGLSVLALF